MDEKKKSESSGEEAVRVGPYQLEEQAPQDDDRHGALYRATHETSGTPALVLEPPVDLKVRIISSVSEGYDAVEVEQSPRFVASDKQSVESMLLTLEDAHRVVERMLRALSASREPRYWRYLRRMRLVGVAVLFVLAFALGRYVPVSPPPGGPEPVASVAPAPMNDEVPTDTRVPSSGHSLRGFEDGGTLVLAHPFPSKPFKGQKRPPCTPRIEVEINGGCWVPHELKAPCPEELFEHQGKCYTTAMLAPRVPQSIGP